MTRLDARISTDDECLTGLCVFSGFFNCARGGFSPDHAPNESVSDWEAFEDAANEGIRRAASALAKMGLETLAIRASKLPRAHVHADARAQDFVEFCRGHNVYLCTHCGAL